MNVATAVIGPDPAKVSGCKFCGAKNVKYDAKGTEWWHPATDCCAPAVTLQLVWRSRDAHFAGQAHDAALDSRIKAELGRVLDDAQADGRVALEAFHHHVRSQAELEAAIAACRDRGYELNFRDAFLALRRRAA